MAFQLLSQREEFLATQIVDIAYKIHTRVGPGLLESVYSSLFCYELRKRNISYASEKSINLIYENVEIKDGLRVDILVDNLVIVELKAQENSHPVWEAQLLTYLKLSNMRLGFLINFHVTLIKNGIKRKIN